MKVLALPSAKDLSEWVMRGGAHATLIGLIRNAPEWKPLSQTNRSGSSLTSLRDLLSELEEKVSGLLADKLPAGGISVLSAKPIIRLGSRLWRAALHWRLRGAHAAVAEAAHCGDTR